MPDEPDPPRKVYGFKAREFERANAPRPEAPSPETSAAPATAPSDEAGRIDVKELIRTGAGDGPQLGSNKVANRTNEVHGVLQANYQNDKAAGHYDLGPLDDSKRRKRIRNYWLLMVVINVPFGGFAYYAGHTNPLPFVCSLSLAVLLSTRLTWQTFFLRTHY